MKIIETDNFCRDYVQDELIVENLDDLYAIRIADILNDILSGPEADSFYRVVKDDYVLNVFDY